MKYFTDFIKAVRLPNLGAIFLAQYLILTKYSGKFNFFSFKLILIPIAVGAFGYMHNNLMDRDLDIQCKKRIPNFYIENKVIFYAFSLFLLGYAFYFSAIFTYFSFEINFINYFLITCFSVFLLVIYNIFLKKTILIGNIIISFLCVLSAIFPVSNLLNKFLIEPKLNTISPNFWFVISSIFIVTLIREIVKDIEDRTCDIQFMYKTAPIVLGIKNTRIIALLLCSIYFFSAVIYSFSYSFYYTLIVLPFIILSMYYLLRSNFSKTSFYLKIVLFLGIVFIYFI